MFRKVICLLLISICISSISTYIYAAGPGGGANGGGFGGGSYAADNNGTGSINYGSDSGSNTSGGFFDGTGSVTSNNPDISLPGASEHNTKLNNVMANAWSTVTVIVQALSIGAVVFAGLRYMFAAADKRADIKRGLGYLTIGAALVFGAVTIAKFIVSVGEHII